MSELTAYYAARASEYDEIYRKPERQADLREIERWLPAVFAGRSVLEVACGTGYWTAFIAPAVSRMVAVDAAPETLRIAAARVPAGKVELVVGDAYALPLAGQALQGAFAGFWLSHVPRSRVREFLAGLHACLAPGATVVLLDNLFVEGSSSPVSGRDEEGNTYQERRLRDGSAHRVLKNFPSEDELLEATAGLRKSVEYRCWQYYWALRYETPAQA